MSQGPGTRARHISRDGQGRYEQPTIDPDNDGYACENHFGVDTSTLGSGSSTTTSGGSSTTSGGGDTGSGVPIGDSGSSDSSGQIIDLVLRRPLPQEIALSILDEVELTF